MSSPTPQDPWERLIAFYFLPLPYRTHHRFNLHWRPATPEESLRQIECYRSSGSPDDSRIKKVFTRPLGEEDRYRWQTDLKAAHKLGFMHLGDLVSRLRYGNPPGDPGDVQWLNPLHYSSWSQGMRQASLGFMHVLWHPVLCCRAQLSPHARVLNLEVQFRSATGPDPLDFSVTTINRIQSPMERLVRHPQRFVHRCPALTFRQALLVHLEDRAQIEALYPVQWLPTFTLQDALTDLDRDAIELEAVYNSYPPRHLVRKLFQLVWRWEPQWQGELKGKLPPSN